MGFPRSSVARFFLVSEREHINRILSCFMTVERYIPRVPKRDHQLSQFRCIGERSPDIGSIIEMKQVTLNRITSTLCSFL